jgi:hypothetical protein
MQTNKSSQTKSSKVVNTGRDFKTFVAHPTPKIGQTGH